MQNPERSPNVCIVIQGQEGAGKDTIVRIAGALLNNHDHEFYYETAEFEQVFGACNSEIDGKIILGIEEISIADTKKYKERMKNLITCEKITIKQIYQQKKQVDNILRIWMTTNSITPIQCDHNQRRNLLFKFPTTRKGDTAYWRWFYEDKVGNEECMATLFWELFDYDLHPCWNDPKRLPKSKEQAMMETENIYPLWGMLDEYFNPKKLLDDEAERENDLENFICYDFEDVPKNCCYITSKKFEKMFLEFCDREHGGFAMFSRKAHIDNHLRDCDAIKCVTRRIDKKKTPLKLINIPALREYMDKENLLGKRSHGNFQQETKE
jgi:hypothetical protein